VWWQITTTQARISPFVEDRVEHEDVGQVHPAEIGVVQDDGVAGGDPAAPALLHRAHRLGDGAQVLGDGLGLGHHLALGVADGGRVVHHVFDDLGLGGADDGVGDLVDDRVHRVLDDGEGDRVEPVSIGPVSIGPVLSGGGVLRHGGPHAVSRSMAMQPASAARAVQPGGTTMVVS
jgi:hypothetical protein